MRETTESLLSAIERDIGGIAIIWCPDLGLRDWLITQVESLAPSAARPFRTDSVEEAIAAPDRMALLVPRDEKETVLELDGSRDRLRGVDTPRTQPVVVFLARNGDGARALAENAPSLASWVRGCDADPEELASVDVPAERHRFTERTGKTPEEWLDSWSSGTSPRTGEAYAIRDEAGASLASDLRKKLIDLAERGHCDSSIRGRFTDRRNGDLRAWYIKGEREELEHLPHIAEAWLTLLILSHSPTHHVHQFTAMLEGVATTGETWVVAVHLETDRDHGCGDRKGDGACGHAALHCHVGASLGKKPEIRVPLPDIGPIEAFDWLLSTVVPGWEPMPWADVLEALRQRG